MLKNELMRRVASYNNQVASLNYSLPDIGSISSSIQALKDSWYTNGSTEVTSYLDKMCSQLETQLGQLDVDVKKLKEQRMHFEFNEEEL